jgi:hypothetical protein
MTKLLKLLQFPLLPPAPVHLLPEIPPLRSLAPVEAAPEKEFIDDQYIGQMLVQIIGPALSIKGRIELPLAVVLPKESPETPVDVVRHDSALLLLVENFRDERQGA